jgi:TonB family protein
MKEVIINYYLEANAAIVFLVLMYLLFLRKEKDFGFKRLYLSGLLVLSLVLPLIRFNTQHNPIPAITRLIQTYTLPEITVGSGGLSADVTTPETGPLITFWQILMIIYLTVASALFLRFVFRLIRLLMLLKDAPITTQRGMYKIIETEEPVANFSFFHYVCIGHVHQLSAAEKTHIINHELAHASSFHSADLLFVELLSIVFWFNPVVHMAKNILTAIQEFQADQQAVKHQNTEEYCHLLAKSALDSANISLANHFNQSLTLKRIAMIHTMKQRIKLWKLAVLLPVLAGGFLLVACQDQAMKEVVENSKTLSQVNESQYPEEVQKEINRLRKNQPDAKFTYIEGEQKEVSDLATKFGDTKKPLAIFAGRPDGTVGILLQDVSGHAENMKDANGVYKVVEEAASPAGGFKEFMTYLQTNLTYPEAARKANLQGKVFVQFVVQEDGSISDVEILKGIGGGCDEEAVRVIANSPKWNPGKQKGIAVKQRMSVPIAFNLGNDSGNSSTGQGSAKSAGTGS